MLEFSQKSCPEFLIKLLKNCLEKSKVALCYESCSKKINTQKNDFVAPLIPLYGLMQKYNKGNFSKHFVQFYGVASVADK